MRHKHSSYLQDLFTNPKTLRETVKYVYDILKQHKSEFSHIAVRGVSGMAIGGIIAYKLKKGLIVVRKTKEDSHASYNVEGCPTDSKFKYIIIDDFISGGDTVMNIMKDIDSMNRESYCHGVILYHAAHRDNKIIPVKETNYKAWASNLKNYIKESGKYDE